jgi:transposase InsO family protein
VYAIQSGELTLGSDNGAALTARRFRASLSELGIRRARDGYRDPEPQTLIESWFGKLKEREVWLNSTRPSTTPARESAATSSATTTNHTRA